MFCSKHRRRMAGFSRILTPFDILFYSPNRVINYCHRDSFMLYTRPKYHLSCRVTFSRRYRISIIVKGNEFLPKTKARLRRWLFLRIFLSPGYDSIIMIAVA